MVDVVVVFVGVQQLKVGGDDIVVMVFQFEFVMFIINFNILLDVMLCKDVMVFVDGVIVVGCVGVKLMCDCYIIMYMVDLVGIVELIGVMLVIKGGVLLGGMLLVDVKDGFGEVDLFVIVFMGIDCVEYVKMFGVEKEVLF